ncbi:hypothetical protein [Solirubrum puertoriconensis]|uniref:Uncharacterized protein n=1 Tax=Solirubrum puertoriconensis TaxID=1751427 RepID=A0A9X0HI41_SOLP1|nr:hypothetical protein [Solirubrum puertoriconensis]KUG06361.1 hypothetical protein ASU33_03115 [Solirubrum puertoriconensis]
MQYATFEDFLFKLPIYTKVQVTDANSEVFLLLLTCGSSFSETAVDGYNPYRSLITTYTCRGNNDHGFVDSLVDEGGYFHVDLTCKRYADVVRFYYIYDAAAREFMKVGQYPSMATYEQSAVKRYQRALSKEHATEFSKAIGLKAHGVGIGSFVYLRRIFERLIEEAHQEALKSQNWDEEVYMKAKMNDKILLLEAYLPGFLVESRVMYSILSKGIHELSEQECLHHFDAIKVGIEIILEEHIEKKAREQRMDEARKAIAQAHQFLGKDSTK